MTSAAVQAIQEAADRIRVLHDPETLTGHRVHNDLQDIEAAAHELDLECERLTNDLLDAQAEADWHTETNRENAT